MLAGRGFTPDGIRAAYDVNPLLEAGYTGKSVTVAVVNTGIDGSFYSDVNTFSAVYGLPDPKITVAEPFGSARTNKESPTVAVRIRDGISLPDGAA